jgi:hypothetical protein
MHQFSFPFGRDPGLAEVLMASSTRSVGFLHAFHRDTTAPTELKHICRDTNKALQTY